MQQYEVRLESPSNPQQFRLLTVGADSPDQAKEIAQRKEIAICEFNLMPPPKDIWEDPHLHHSDDGRVDARLWDNFDPLFMRETQKHTDYADAKRAGKARLEEWASRSVWNRSGKLVTTLGARSKARYAMHLQQDPFEVADVRDVPRAEIDAQRLVREARQLAQHDPKQWQKVLDGLRDGGVPLAAVTAALFGVPTKNRSDGTANGAVDWHASTADTFKVMLTTSTYVLNATAYDTHDFKNDVTNEATGTNWAAGGVTLAAASLTSAYDSTTDQARYDGPDIAQATTTVTARNGVVYRSTGTDTTSALISGIDFGADVSTTAGTFSMVWDTTGVWLIDVT